MSKRSTRKRRRKPIHWFANPQHQKLSKAEAVHEKNAKEAKDNSNPSINHRRGAKSLLPLIMMMGLADISPPRRK